MTRFSVLTVFNISCRKKMEMLKNYNKPFFQLNMMDFVVV